MWYALQTKSGEEERVINLLKITAEKDISINYLIPLYEHVRRNAESYRLTIRRLFPGYILIETGRPKELKYRLKKVPEFTKLLGVEGENEDCFIGISDDEMKFLDTLLVDNLIHLSYIEMKNSRINKVIGPLAEYIGNVTRLDVQHRRAIVEKDILGKHRKIYFGLLTEKDPPHPWVMEQIQGGNEGIIVNKRYDIGMHEGDYVRGINGTYEDSAMKVVRVDAERRIVTVEMDIFSQKMKVPMFADNLEKI